MQKLLTFFSKNISVYVIFNDQSFNDTLTNDIVSFEQLGPECLPLSELFTCFNARIGQMYNSGSSAVDVCKTVGLE